MLSRFRIIVFAIAAVLLATVQAFAQSGAEINCDSTRISMADMLQCSVTISIDSSNDITDITMPSFQGFKILNENTSSQQQTTIVNFKMESKQIRTTTYALSPLKPGSFEIGPAIFKNDGRLYRSSVWRVQVDELEVRTEGQYWGDAGISAPLSDRERNDSSLFIRLIPEKRELYSGSSMLATLYLYTRNVNASQLKQEAAPTFEGFRYRNMDISQNEGVRRMSVGGKVYNVQPVVRALLTPEKEGRLNIDPFRVSVGVDTGDFFNRIRWVSRASEPLEIQVKPLPLEGQPVGFDPTHVGSFELKSRIDRRVTEVNQPVAYTLSLKCQTDPANVQLPQLMEIEGFKAYPPSTKDNSFQQGNHLAGEKIAEYLLVPQREGQLVIPSLSFTSFDPDSGQYTELKTEEYRISVKPASGAITANGTITPRQELQAEAGSMRPIKITPVLEHQESGEFVYSKLFLLLLLLPPGLLLLLELLDLLRWLRPRLSGGERARLERELKKLESEASALIASDGTEFFSKVMAISYKQLEIECSESLVGLTHEQLSTRLSEKGWTADSIAALLKIFDRCELGRYAPSSMDRAVRTDLLKDARRAGKGALQ